RGNRPPILPQLLEIYLFVGVNDLIHKRQQLGPKPFHLVRISEIHGDHSFAGYPERGGARRGRTRARKSTRRPLPSIHLYPPVKPIGRHPGEIRGSTVL